MSARTDVAAKTATSAPPHTQALASWLEGLPVNGWHVFIVGICALGMFFDGLELTISSVFATIFNPKAGVSPQQLAMLLTAALAGAAIGAPMFGYVGDKFGRRLALTLALLGFGLLSIVCGLTPDLRTLTVARFFACFAIGAYQPVMAAYLVDILPRGARGRMILWTSVPAGIGSASPMFFTRYFDGLAHLGTEGWRITLFIGGAGGLLVALLTWLLLPESPRWLLSVGRRPQLDIVCSRLQGRTQAPPWTTAVPSAAGIAALSPVVAAPNATLFGRQYRNRTFLFLGLQLLVPWAVSFVTLQGAIFAHRGYGVSNALLYTGLAVLALPVGALLASFVIDRIERGRAIAIGAAGLAMLALGFAFAREAWQAVVVAGLFDMIVGSFAVAVLIYGSEMFATEIRARATTLGYASNRIGAIIVPSIALPLLHERGEIAPMALIAISQALLLILVLTLGRRFRDQARQVREQQISAGNGGAAGVVP